MPHFIFYDLETSGLNTRFGQVFQFAAVLTDQDLNILDEFEIRSRRMPHIVPDPGALLVTGLKPQSIDQARYSYYEFSTEVRNKFLEWSPATISGYNIFSFDEHFLRSMFYQNLHQPYLTQTNGNSRLDILPLVRAAEYLYPGLINYPLNAKGKTSKRLEDVAPANGFASHQAHDAMGDVVATVHMARIIKRSATLLWSKAVAATSRPLFNSLLERGRTIIIHDDNYGWPVTFPALEIGKVDGGRNTLFFDLRRDPALVDLADTDACFLGRLRPFRLCRDSEVPLTFTLEEFAELDLHESFDLETVQELLQAAQSNLVFEEVVGAFNGSRKSFETSEHVEGQIYDDFHAFDEERWLMNDFHNADPELKITLSNRFKDRRFETFAKRIVFDNCRNHLNPETVAEYDERIKNRIRNEDEVPWTTLPKAIAECDLLLSQNKWGSAEINGIRNYLIGLGS